jgi:propionate CoA-transferase
MNAWHGHTTAIQPMPMSHRKIIARRPAMELSPNSVVNLGIGIPEVVASVAAEETVADLMTLTNEPTFRERARQVDK